MGSVRLKLLRVWVSQLSSSYPKLCSSVSSFPSEIAHSSAVLWSESQEKHLRRACLPCTGWHSVWGLLGPVIINAIIIITEPVVGPLVDTVISVFDEKVEIWVRTRAMYYFCLFLLPPS